MESVWPSIKFSSITAKTNLRGTVMKRKLSTYKNSWKSQKMWVCPSLEQQTDTYSGAGLWNNYLSLQEPDCQQLQLKLEEVRFRSRRSSLGNMKLIGELFKLKIVTEKTVHRCLVKLLKDEHEESLECLSKLITTIGKDLDTQNAKVHTHTQNDANDDFNFIFFVVALSSPTWIIILPTLTRLSSGEVYQSGSVSCCRTWWICERWIVFDTL